MQEQAGNVMAGRLQMVKLAVQHVRQPRQRVPVAGVQCRKRPLYALGRQPRLHSRIAADIIRIIQVNKTEPAHRPIGASRDERQEHADQNRLAPARSLAPRNPCFSRLLHARHWQSRGR